MGTRHAGIPDVVIEDQTGFLVDERDADGMGRQLGRLLGDPALAGDMGRAGRLHVAAQFAIERRLAQLWAIIEGAIAARPRSPERCEARPLEPLLDS